MYLRCGSGPISFLISGYFSVGKNKGIMYCAISISHASIITSIHEFYTCGFH